MWAGRKSEVWAMASICRTAIRVVGIAAMAGSLGLGAAVAAASGPAGHASPSPAQVHPGATETSKQPKGCSSTPSLSPVWESYRAGDPNPNGSRPLGCDTSTTMYILL